MEESTHSMEERNSDVQAWSESEQSQKGNNTNVDYVSTVFSPASMEVEPNDVARLQQIWSQWDHLTREAFKKNYGDIAFLLWVTVDRALLRTLVNFWNPAYNCFTFGDFDLTPTVEEYQDLINCSRVVGSKVFSKPIKQKSFREKLRRLANNVHNWENNSSSPGMVPIF